MKYKILFLKILLLSTVSYAQKEGNIWYFGNRAGLNFNSGMPAPITNSVMNTREGCSSISDHNGNLLFYTNGIRVWNRNHAQMPNGFGLMGHSSSTQSALIVQDPGNSLLYYVFTVPAQPQDGHYGVGQPVDFYYNIVDMSLNGGLGDVAIKNMLLLEHVTEKLTAVRHANGHDIWVIVHEYETDGFASFLVNCSGLNTLPVMSYAGTVHIKDAVDNNMVGQMKVSADGKKIALAIVEMGIMEIFDFDNATGLVSNPVTLPKILPGNDGMTYGVEFSPDGTKLYGSLITGFRLYQYDLMAGSAADIINSRTLVGTSPGSFLFNEFGALQLGPDGRIYCARLPISQLGVVNNPNASGTACNYVNNGVWLGSRLSMAGLPTFMQSHFEAQFSHTNPCVGDSTFFFISNTNSIDSVHWDFGDPASGTSNTSSDMNPYHLYSTPGNYNVQLTKYSGACTSVFSRTVTITAPYPPADLGNDTSLCHNVSLVLDVTMPNSTYLWQDGSTSSSFTVISSGTYWVEVTTPCSVTSDTVVIEYFDPPEEVNLGNDTTFCQGQPLLLDATLPGTTYLWQDGATTPTYDVISSGLYWVEVSNADGCSARDSITVEVVSPTHAGPDRHFCLSGDAVQLNATGGTSFTWTPTDSLSCTDCQNPLASPTLTTTYIVTSDQLSECNTDTVVVYLVPDFSINLEPTNSVICRYDSIQLEAVTDAAYAPYTYLWTPSASLSGASQADPVAKPLITTTYIVIATSDTGCTRKDSITVTVREIEPNIYPAASDTVICAGTAIQLSAGFVCGTSTMPCSGPVSSGTIGTDTAYFSPTQYPAPYGNNRWGARHQMLFLASELNAMGINGKITALAFDIANMNGSTSTYNNFSIRMKCIANSVVTNTWETGFHTVFPAQNITVATGWNTHHFSNFFEWDGISNILIEICFNNNSVTQNASTRATLTGFNSVAVSSANNTNACSSGNPQLITAWRPNIRFDYCEMPLSNYTFNWSPGQTLSDSMIYAPIANPLETTTYRLAVSDEGCAPRINPLTITVHPLPTVDAGPDKQICPGNAVELAAAASTPTGGLTYNWSNASFLNDPAISNPVATPDTTTDYIVNVTTDFGCEQSDTLTVFVYYVAVNTNSISTTCFGGSDGMASVTVSAGSGFYSYVWDPGGQTESFIANVPAGIYTVTIIDDSTNCTYDATIVVNQAPAMVPEYTTEAEICGAQNGSATVTFVAHGTAPFLYSWNGGSPSADNKSGNLGSGIYQIIITDANACSITDSVVIEEALLTLKADFGYELIPCTNEIQFLNLSTDTLSNHWDFGDGTTSNQISPLHFYQAKEKYTVILILAPNSPCADTAQAVIPFENDAISDTLFIPNIFTPNGDGKNDYFEIIGMDNPCITFHKLMVFDRWGLKVFESVGNQFIWDGASNKNALAEGVYFYVLEGEEFTRSGSVTLLR